MLLNDRSISTLHAALNGLSQRERAVTNNISNVNTPYYRARNVAFEASLRSAVQNGDNPLAVTPTTRSPFTTWPATAAPATTCC